MKIDDASDPYDPNKATRRLIIVGVIVAVVVFAASKLYVVVPAGHVAVATLFGEVQDAPLTEGLHIPVNPLMRFTEFDVRQMSHKEDRVGIPTQDQLITLVDASLQWRIDGAAAARILRDTGTAERAVEVHLMPKLRSVLREQGKSVAKAQDFFRPETQQKLQEAIFTEMQNYLAPMGITVSAILLRDIQLPESVRVTVERTVQTEQEIVRQKAELERQKIEAQKGVVQASAEREAAEQEALKRRTLADAQAYEIEKINTAIANNPAYIQLQALKALSDISKDPASKMYFMDGNSTMPLPLMHMGDVPGGIRK